MTFSCILPALNSALPRTTSHPAKLKLEGKAELTGTDSDESEISEVVLLKEQFGTYESSCRRHVVEPKY
jgi:hypothetical protein